jgi:hypothetical protein
MQTRVEFGTNMAEKCIGSILMTDDIVQGRDKITNYGDDEQKSIGDQFTIVAAITNLCAVVAKKRNAVPTTVDMYESFTSMFVQSALNALMISGVHKSPDEVSEWSASVGKGVSEYFYHHEIDPTAIFDVAMESVEEMREYVVV